MSAANPNGLSILSGNTTGGNRHSNLSGFQDFLSKLVYICKGVTYPTIFSIITKIFDVTQLRYQKFPIWFTSIKKTLYKFVQSLVWILIRFYAGRLLLRSLRLMPMNGGTEEQVKPCSRRLLQLVFMTVPIVSKDPHFLRRTIVIDAVSLAYST